jgi:hypothetical protein
MRATLLIALGIVIGGVATAFWSSPVKAQGGGRFSMVGGHPAPVTSIVLVKDSQSSGCWLMAQNGASVSLAPAPAEACK